MQGDEVQKRAAEVANALTLSGIDLYPRGWVAAYN